MKTEDFNKLKAICEKEGFELLNESPNDNDKFFVVKKKKDEWDGVEFVEYIGHPWPDGRTIFKVISIGDKINIVDGSIEGGNLLKSNCKPSTEQAYIEQLKKEAFERFGGELDSGKIDDSSLKGGRIEFTFDTNKNDPFRYRKDTDTLYWFGIPIYQQGHWAKRVPERVEVEAIDWDYEQGNYFADKFAIRFKSKNLGDRDYDKISKFLEKQLDKYLNNELE